MNPSVSGLLSTSSEWASWTLMDCEEGANMSVNRRGCYLQTTRTTIPETAEIYFKGYICHKEKKRKQHLLSIWCTSAMQHIQQIKLLYLLIYYYNYDYIYDNFIIICITDIYTTKPLPLNWEEKYDAWKHSFFLKLWMYSSRYISIILLGVSHVILPKQKTHNPLSALTRVRLETKRTIHDRWAPRKQQFQWLVKPKRKKKLCWGFHHYECALIFCWI